MYRAVEYQPTWVSPPGNTISELLKLKGINISDFASVLNTSSEITHELIRGAVKIDKEIALRLEEALGPSVEFWMRREQQYRNDVARSHLLNEVSSDHEFLSHLPVSDMRRFGWIDTANTKAEKLSACLKFFAVAAVNEWQQQYSSEVSVAAFRTSPSFEANPYAVAAWLRQGEIESEKINCAPWNKVKFQKKLQDLKALSRIKEPARFLPALVKACAECGVAVVVARAPKGCHASGATKFISSDKAVIVMSFRYRSDDQFWFTFFHEAAHLILHAKDALFLEDGSDVTSSEEAEANEFAARVLISDELQNELLTIKCTLKGIVSFARRAGVSSGIVVGQLQHLGRVRHDKLNSLKRRYQWGIASTPQLIP